MTVLFFYLLGFAGTLAWRLYVKRRKLTGFYARHVENEEIVFCLFEAVFWPIMLPLLLIVEAIRTIMHISVHAREEDD